MPDPWSSSDPAERLLEDFWEAREQRASRRELCSEFAAAALFLAAAGGLLALPHATAGFAPAVAALLVALYVLVARVEFPVGTGHVVPTQLVLVPMLVLLPPATVPALAAGGLVVGALWDWARGRGRPERLLFSLSDAWHAIGPAGVLLLAGSPRIGFDDAPLMAAALAAGGLVDLASAMLREAASRGVAPSLQLRVIVPVWAVDACLAPIGMLAAVATDHGLGAVLLVLPLGGLLLLLARDRSARIAQAHRRLELVKHERSRLQTAVRRMGDAFAAKLDLDALLTITLRGSLEALDADAGRLTLSAAGTTRELESGDAAHRGAALRAAAEAAAAANSAQQLDHHDGWVLALPLRAADAASDLRGVLCLARRARLSGR